jgi:hypothetical protein
MVETAIPAAVRLTVLGPGGEADLAVAPGALARDLLVADVLDPAADAPSLATVAGALLDPDRRLDDQGVEDGALIVVLPATAGPGAGRPASRRALRTETAAAPAGGRALAAAPRWGLLAGGLLALAGAAAVATGPRPFGVPVALLLAALAAVAVPPRTAPLAAVRTAGAALAALGVWLLVGVDGPGRPLLAATAAAVAAALAAAAARTTGRGDEPLLVELLAGCAVAAGCALGLVLGAPGTAVACLAAGAILPLVRLLPSSVVDVPDDVLLELDRLSVTAWSARDSRTGARRRRRVRLRQDDVAGTVGRGRRLLRAWSVAAAAATAVLSGGLAATEHVGWARAGVPVLLACLAAGLPLVARGLRERVPRVALLLGGLVAGTATGALLLTRLGDGPWAVAVPCALAVAGVGVAVAGAALGRGWRSVRWARFADGVEALAVVLVLPAALVAAGAVEWVRALVA